MFRLLLNLLKHRVTWKFLLVLLVALGVTSDTQDLIGRLEALLCAVLSCTD